MDNGDVLTPAQYKTLDSLYTEHERKTSNEIVLFTLDDYTGEEKLRDFGLKMAKKLGVGKKNINNGLFILFCAKCHKIEILTGKGTEKVMTDAIAQTILDTAMIPFFKEGAYYDGLLNGSKAMITFLERPENKIK